MQTKTISMITVFFLSFIGCSGACYGKMSKMTDAQLAEVTGSGFIAGNAKIMGNEWFNISSAPWMAATQTFGPVKAQTHKNPGISIWIDDVVIKTSAHTTMYIDNDGSNDNRAAAIFIKNLSSESVMTINAIK